MQPGVHDLPVCAYPPRVQLLAHPFFGKVASRRDVAAQLLGHLPLEEKLHSMVSLPMLSLSSSSGGSGGLLSHSLRRSSSVSGVGGGLASGLSW